MNNYISSRNKSQLKNQQSLELRKDILFQAANKFKDWSKAKMKAFNYAVQSCARYDQVDPSQSTIGKNSGIGRQRTNVIMGELDESTWISKRYRHLNTCVYKLNDVFNEPDIRKLLSPFFPAMQLLPIIYLLSCQAENATLDLVNIKDLSKPTLTYNVSTKKICGLVGQGGVKRGENVVEPDVGVPKYILDIKEIDLTAYGRVRLTCFPMEAIAEARRQIKQAKTVAEPFAYFFKICKNWCDAHNTHPEFQAANELAMVHGFTHEDTLLNSKKVISEPRKASYSNYKKSEDAPVIQSSQERLVVAKAAAQASAIPPGQEIEKIKKEIECLQEKIERLDALGVPEFLLTPTRERFLKDLEYYVKRLVELS